jgi:galactokinase
MTVSATAPGRVNLIGDHVDYAGGLVMPVAIDLAITVSGSPGEDAVVLESDAEDASAVVPLDIVDPASLEPAWARYVGGVVAELRPATGFSGRVQSTVPVGAGLSSSAALEVAVALALGADPSDPAALARLCQRAEQRATGVPCGIMDQLCSVAGVAGHALLIDCRSLAVTPVPVPEQAEIVVVHSGDARALAVSAYGERRAEVAAAEEVVGPLREASLNSVEQIPDRVVRRRARHVITEIARVAAAAEALGRGDVVAVGQAMGESHASLAGDFDVSTPALDARVAELSSTPGVWGARLTGAGFGGCVVALTDPGAVDVGRYERAWRVTPSAGATVSLT